MVKDWKRIHAHNKEIKETKADYLKCLSCVHNKRDPKQFPCTWCVHLPVEILDYYEKRTE